MSLRAVSFEEKSQYDRPHPRKKIIFSVFQNSFYSWLQEKRIFPMILKIFIDQICDSDFGFYYWPGANVIKLITAAIYDFLL